MYTVSHRSKVDEIFKKLAKKNPKQLEIIAKKLQQILESPHRFKLLSNTMKGQRRVHIDESFVLVYSIDERNRVVIIEDYDHHDNIYKK